MNIDNNTNISSLVSSQVSKLNLKPQKPFVKEETKFQELNENEVKEQDISLMEEKNVSNGIDVEEIQKYAEIMGEKLTTEDINYALKYGRSVIADYSA